MEEKTKEKIKNHTIERNLVADKSFIASSLIYMKG
jgi:hypothetical protein